MCPYAEVFLVRCMLLQVWNLTYCHQVHWSGLLQELLEIQQQLIGQLMDLPEPSRQQLNLIQAGPAPRPIQWTHPGTQPCCSWPHMTSVGGVLDWRGL